MLTGSTDLRKKDVLTPTEHVFFWHSVDTAACSLFVHPRSQILFLKLGLQFPALIAVTWQVVPDVSERVVSVTILPGSVVPELSTSVYASSLLVESSELGPSSPLSESMSCSGAGVVDADVVVAVAVAVACTLYSPVPIMPADGWFL